VIRALAAALALFAPLVTPAQPSTAAPAQARPDLTAGAASGAAASTEGRVEILGERLPVGRRVDLPEGWFRVEEAGDEDGRVGSFAVVSPAAFRASGEAGDATDATLTADDAGPAPAATPPAAQAAPRAEPRDCRAEQSAYLAELLRMSGIEVADPAALMAGLEGDLAPALGTLWLALSTDVLRPLAWSSALRERASALTRCVQGG
jgi:hypothetical protein